MAADKQQLKEEAHQLLIRLEDEADKYIYGNVNGAITWSLDNWEENYQREWKLHRLLNKAMDRYLRRYHVCYQRAATA